MMNRRRLGLSQGARVSWDLRHAMSTTIKVFRYVDEADAFLATAEYREIADTLGLAEWNPVVWIGRLFILDNDYGEHWFDNWELREERGLSEEYLIVDPARFKNDKAGPCNPPELRKHFWTDVLKSLELSLDLLFEKARQANAAHKEFIERLPGDSDLADLFIPDLEDRIRAIKERFQ
jgi:hypothetical protein